MSPSTRASDSPRSKAALICSVCGYRAPTDEGWLLASRDHRTDLICPDCGAVVVSQPRFDADGESVSAVA